MAFLPFACEMSDISSYLFAGIVAHALVAETATDLIQGPGVVDPDA